MTETIKARLIEGRDYLPSKFTEYQVTGVSGENTGGGTVGVEYITFYDYDGTVVYSYSQEEASELDELPEVPQHEGLSSTGWNMTLEEVRSSDTPLDVAATYITDDGITRLYITVEDAERSELTLRLSCSEAGGAFIDWGDGSEVTTLDSDAALYTHEYGTIGEYVIRITAVSGTWQLVGEASTDGATAFGYTSTSAAKRVYPNMLRRAEFGAGVEAIGDFALSWCGMLETVTLPRGILSIGEYAFRCCYRLKFLGIPSGVTEGGAYMCAYCEGMTALSIPSSFTKIPAHMCYSCMALSRVALPAGVVSIGGTSFYGCTSMTEFYIPAGVTAIESYTFQACYSLLYVKIPDEVTSFGSYAFHGCRHLSEISFPASLLSIGDYAFYVCYCLSSARIPDGVTTIGARVFYECATVPEFTVPSSTVSIGNYAFYGCRSVHDYYVYAATPPTLGGTSVFSGIASDCVIHVPSESLSAYQSATRWSSLTAYIAGDL